MTFKELLDSVTFEEVEEQIVRMYPDMIECLGWFKIHFDVLRLMTPKRHEDANDDVCRITMRDWEDGTKPCLDAHPMEGDLWEHSLTKELIIAPDVKATNAELAACCLWHTSFYGFTEKQISERFSGYANSYVNKKGELTSQISKKEIAKRYFNIIRENGGVVPTLRELSPAKRSELKNLAKRTIWYGSKHVNRIKRKMLFRKEFMEHYYERMIDICEFIIKTIPAFTIRAGHNYLSIKDICQLFKSDSFCSVEIKSYADEKTDSAIYLLELIKKYDMLPNADNVVVYIAHGFDNNVDNYIRHEEWQLYDAICSVVHGKKGNGGACFIENVIPELGRQTVVEVICYNGEDIDCKKHIYEKERSIQSRLF